jgi:hypothetical protein
MTDLNQWESACSHLKVDFTSFNLSKCERRLVNSRNRIQIDYELKTFFCSKRDVLHFLCMYAGREAGRTSVTFDSQDSASNADDAYRGEQTSKSCSVMSG